MGGRRGVRAQLACQRCRKRKVRCSGEWPGCKDCDKRGFACIYATGHPDAPEAQAQKVESLLPSSDHVENVVGIFFDYYGSTFFSFVVRHRFLQDLADGIVPLPLLFSILALASRFYEPFYNLYNGTLEACERFAELARNELRPSFDEASLLNLQCYLILSLHEMGSGHENRAWMQLGIAARIVHVLRLHRETGFERTDWVDAETKRRTFWCCFILDRLMSSGLNRPPSFDSDSIATFLPAADSDFVLGREARTNSLAHQDGEENLLSYTIRIVDILGSIISWSGNGGRDIDNRCPWEPDMPFSKFEQSLDLWVRLLPRYMQLTPASINSHIACNQGNLFALMHLFYYHARCFLHREYLPFIPPPNYDPENGPIDGPQLIGPPEPPHWWRQSVHKGVQSARQISTFFAEMIERDLAPWAYPFSGICLMTAATFHVCCSNCLWKSCNQYMGMPAKRILAEDLLNMIKVQESWPLAAHWIRVSRRYYERLSIASSISQSASLDETMAAEGIMQLQDNIGQPISAVNDVPEGTQVHLPRREHDIYTLLRLDAETSNIASAILPAGEVPEELSSTMRLDDILSLDTFLSSWQYDNNMDISFL